MRHLLRVDGASAAPHSASKKSMRTADTKAPFRPNAFCSQLRFPISATSDRLLNLAQARSATGTGKSRKGSTAYGSCRMQPTQPAVGKKCFYAPGLLIHMSCAHTPSKGQNAATRAFLRWRPSDVSSHRVQSLRNELFDDVFARRRACTSRIRVARVSRSIGKSDSTAKRARWQVGFLRGGSTSGY